jgi:hypothetical protein
LFILVCVCVLFVLSFLVWFFLWLPEEVLTVLFFLCRENGDFSILMKDILLYLIDQFLDLLSYLVQDLFLLCCNG